MQTAMIRIILSAALAAVAAPSFGVTVTEAVQSEHRLESDLARDAGRKPAAVLEFFGVANGDRILEVGAGSGYYTELLSASVGDEGFVHAYNPYFFFQLSPEALKERFSSGRHSNVALTFASSLPGAELAENTFDTAYFINIYHDLHYREANGSTISDPARLTLEEVRRVLKPGGSIAVIDHRANSGTTRAEAAGLHRIVEETLIKDFAMLGFELVDQSDVLTNQDDDHLKPWFSDPERRDTTDRMILLFKNTK